MGGGTPLYLCIGDLILVLSGSVTLKVDSFTQGVLFVGVLEILWLAFSKCNLLKGGDRYLSSSYKMNTTGGLSAASFSSSRQLSWTHSVCRNLQVHSPPVPLALRGNILMFLPHPIL